MKNDNTGVPYSLEEFNQSTNVNVPSFSAAVNFNGGDQPQSYFQEAASFTAWRDMSDTLWFYWGRYGRLVLFDLKGRRLVGSLGPNGFSRDVAGDGARFQRPPSVANLANLQGQMLGVGGTVEDPLVNTATALYRVDFLNYRATSIFSTTDDDPIGGIGEYSWKSQEPDLAIARTAVVTRHFFYLLGPKAGQEWKAPYRGHYPEYNQFKLYHLSPEGHYALWCLPDPQAQQHAGGKLPIQVTWFVDGHTNKTAQVPDLDAPRPAEFTAADAVMSVLASPGIVTFTLLFPDQLGPTALRSLCVSLAAAALLCLPLGAWLGHRYRVGLRAQLGWAAFHLLFGIPGLLAFVSVQEWPGREPCPNCRRLRVVNHEHCEHCGSSFPAPAPTGIEIFEPVNAGEQQIMRRRATS